jgi:hypothetical protein
MPNHLARKSMTLFAEKVAPALRHESFTYFDKEYPGVNLEQSMEAVH